MNHLTQESLLRLLKDSRKKGELLTNYADYDLTAEEVICFVKGIDKKSLISNASHDTLDKVRDSLEKIGIDYTKRGNTLACKQVSNGDLRYDFTVEMSDEEYQMLCDVFYGQCEV